MQQNQKPAPDNPLDAVQDAEKLTAHSKETTKPTFDEEFLRTIMLTGDNTKGMFEPAEKEAFEKEDTPHEEETSVLVAGDITPTEKYKDNFVKDILQNPKQYKIMTPRGEMTVVEAIRKGYNPITKQFEARNSTDSIEKKHMRKMNEKDREAFEGITDPRNAQLSDEQAQQFGVPGDSLLKAPAPASTPMEMPPEEGEENPQADLAAMLGGK